MSVAFRRYLVRRHEPDNATARHGDNTHLSSTFTAVAIIRGGLKNLRYPVRAKKRCHYISCPLTPRSADRCYEILLQVRLSREFVRRSSIKIAPCCKCVVILFCEIFDTFLFTLLSFCAIPWCLSDNIKLVLWPLNLSSGSGSTRDLKN